MMDKPSVRESGLGDAASIDALYPRAFPDEELRPLVHALATDPQIVLSLVATIDDAIVGHGMFTRCGVSGSDAGAALLGPVAVDPDWQRRGVGSALIRYGLERLTSDGVAIVCVLGDPAYYGRLGFSTESTIEAPYRLPDEWAEAWQSQRLGDRGALDAGALSVPHPWQDPALWGA